MLGKILEIKYYIYYLFTIIRSRILAQSKSRVVIIIIKQIFGYTILEEEFLMIYI